jgi:hypothetical protein
MSMSWRSARELGARHPTWIAGGLLLLLGAGPGAFLAPSAAEAVLNVLLLGLLLAVPAAQGVDRPLVVWRRRYLLAAAVLIGTVLWDWLTSRSRQRRAFLSEWPLVYSSSLLRAALPGASPLASWLRRKEA